MIEKRREWFAYEKVFGELKVFSHMYYVPTCTFLGGGAEFICLAPLWRTINVDQ